LGKHLPQEFGGIWENWEKLAKQRFAAEEPDSSGGPVPKDG